jgi:hypothetical protein
MGSECSPGVRLADGDRIKGYQVLKAFDPGSMTFTAKAKSAAGRTVFLKKYRRPTALMRWYQPYIDYQQQLKQTIEANPVARNLCYELIEFFELNDPSSRLTRAYYQVVEWVDGGSDLKKVIQLIRSGSKDYSWNQRVIFARVLMAGVRALHEAGVIHTDLKPDNFFLIPDESILAKFKLRVIDLDNSLIEGRQAPWHGQPGEGYVGTPMYFSPEHVTGKVPLKASDVFTCGLILGELLGSGHPAAGKENYDDLIQGKAGGLKRIALEGAVAEAPDTGFLEYVLNSCLEPDPTRRPTAEQVLRALNGRLEAFQGRSPSAGGTAPAASPTATPAAKPAPSTPAHATAKGELELSSPDGAHRLPVRLPAVFGKPQFESWGPEYGRFLSVRQFKLSKGSDGAWTLEHHPEGTNSTNAAGAPVTGAIPVTDGMVITLGKTGKCPIHVRVG